MTTEIYYRIHDLIEGCMDKAKKAGNTAKYQAARKRLADFERAYEEDYAEHDDDEASLDGLDPGFASWNDYYNYMYG